MGKDYKIYALINPLTDSPFYVGATKVALKARLSGHIGDPFYNTGVLKKKHHLIQSIIKSGHRPVIRLLKEVSIDNVNKFESFYYRKFIRQGHELLQKEVFLYQQTIGSRTYNKNKFNYESNGESEFVTNT